jgi:methyl-accepting chemotaxis protein
VVNTISFSIKIRNQQLESIISEKEKNALLLDEMKSVMDVIQNTTKAVHHIYNDLMTTSDLAANSIQQLSNGVEEIADSLSTQCDRSTDMQNKLLHTTNMSNRIVEKTHQSADQVHEGKNTFLELDSYSDLIMVNNRKVYDQMLSLEKSAEEIKGVVDVIQKIAVQTNMLALNASIESARAGEAGKGFAVVADSVRELSVRTSESLEGINNLIDRLESNAEISLRTAEESLRFGDNISALIRMTRTLFEEIDEIIAQANKEITETVVTTEEVVHSNQAVVDHIATISQSVKESATNAKSVSERVAQNKALTLKAKAHMDELAQLVERV